MNLLKLLTTAGVPWCAWASTWARKSAPSRPAWAPVPLHQHEWDAYVSWVYNVGTAAACRSTLVRKLKATPPDYAGACAELLKWDKFKGQALPGLTARRQQEHRACLGMPR